MKKEIEELKPTFDLNTNTVPPPTLDKKVMGELVELIKEYQKLTEEDSIKEERKDENIF